MREVLADELDAAGVVLGTVPAVHGGDDAVGAGLQRHVEVLGDAIAGGEEMDEIPGDVQWLDGADAETFDGGFVEDAAEKIFEIDAGRKVATVGAKVDAAEDDFAEAGFAEALNFLKDHFGREAAAFSADEGNDAIGTAGIAAVLNLER